MLYVTKARSKWYPMREYRLQLREYRLHGTEMHMGREQSVFGSLPVAEWFSTSTRAKADFGIVSGSPVDLRSRKFDILFAGVHPNGTPLRRASITCPVQSKGAVTVPGESKDVAPVPEESKGAAKSSYGRPVNAFDLTFSAPKEVSLLLAKAMIDRDYQTIDALRLAVDKAAKKTMRRLRAYLIGYRRKEGGAVKQLGGEIVAVFFTHFSARPTEDAERESEGDEHLGRRPKLTPGMPQLHIHVYMMNTVRTPEKDYLTLDAGRFLTQIKRIGLWFRSYLAEQLKALGLRVESVVRRGAVTGEIRLPEVPQKLVAKASRRGRKADEFLASPAAKAAGIETKRKAIAATRKGKDDSGPLPLESWVELLAPFAHQLPRIKVPQDQDREMPAERESVAAIVARLRDKAAALENPADPVELEELILKSTLGQVTPDRVEAVIQALQESLRTGKQVATADRDAPAAPRVEAAASVMQARIRPFKTSSPSAKSQSASEQPNALVNQSKAAPAKRNGLSELLRQELSGMDPAEQLHYQLALCFAENQSIAANARETAVRMLGEQGWLVDSPGDAPAMGRDRDSMIEVLLDASQALREGTAAAAALLIEGHGIACSMPALPEFGEALQPMGAAPR